MTMMPLAERCFALETKGWFTCTVTDPEARVLYDGPDRSTAEDIADWYRQRYGWRPEVRRTTFPNLEGDL